MRDVTISIRSGELPFGVTATRRRRAARRPRAWLLPTCLLLALAAVTLAGSPTIADICGQSGIACGP
jgi:hypothetical protein